MSASTARMKNVTTVKGVAACLRRWMDDEAAKASNLQLLETPESEVKLPFSIVLPNGKCPLSQIFVRKAYLDVYQRARGQSILQRRQLCITGTPGTGKSVLGVYCFLRVILAAEPLTAAEIEAEEFTAEQVTEEELAGEEPVEPNVFRYYYSCGENYLTVDIENAENAEPVYRFGSWEEGTDVGDPRIGVRFMVFDLLNPEIAYKISNITKTKWLKRSFLVIMSPDSVYDSTGKENFSHGSFIKYVYPPWEGREQSRFKRFIKENLLKRVGMHKDAVRAICWDIISMTKFPERIPAAAKKDWLNKKMKKVAEDFLDVVNGGNFPDMSLPHNQHLLHIILDYREHMIGFNIRLMFDGNVHQLLDQFSKTPNRFFNRFFELVFNDNKLAFLNSQFMNTGWHYHKKPSTPIVQDIYILAKARITVRDKLNEMTSYGNVAQQGWSFETVSFAVLAHAGWFDLRWDNNRKLALPSRLAENADIDRVKDVDSLNYDMLYKPNSPVQPAIDMFFCTQNDLKPSTMVALSIVLVQVTLAKKHPIKSDALLPIVEHLRKKAGKQTVKWFFLYFVGRENYFEPSTDEVKLVIPASAGSKKKKVIIKIPVYVTSLVLQSDYLIR